MKRMPSPDNCKYCGEATCKYCDVFKDKSELPYECFIEAIIQVTCNLSTRHKSGKSFFYLSMNHFFVKQIKQTRPNRRRHALTNKTTTNRMLTQAHKDIILAFL